MEKPTYHILVCNSFRVGGDPRGVCNRKDATDLLQLLENEVVDRGIDALVSSTGCLKQCEQGPGGHRVPGGLVVSRSGRRKGRPAFWTPWNRANRPRTDLLAA